jgi:hypothetical protein
MSLPLYRLCWKDDNGIVSNGKFCLTLDQVIMWMKHMKDSDKDLGIVREYWMESEYEFRGY